jgi:hypothetical protein
VETGTDEAPSAALTDGLDRKAGVERRPDQPVAGVGDARRSGVRNERQRVPGGDLVDQEGDLPPFVVLVEARRRRADIVPTQEPGRVAGVLRGDERNLAEDPEGDAG